MRDEQGRLSWSFPKIGQPLTRQEHCVLLLMSRGTTTREIAALAGVGPDTVKFHLKNIYGKLGATRRTQAVMLAQRQGILPVAGTAGSPPGAPRCTPPHDADECSATGRPPVNPGCRGPDMPLSREPADRGEQFDPGRRYVRVTKRRPNGLVEFEFAIGEPGISIEMALGSAAFEEFCANNRVVHLAPDSEAPAGRDCSLDWHLRDATRRRLGGT